MIYLDNQSTTRVDPRVVEAMLPTFDVQYGNAGSITHELGIAAKDMVQSATQKIAASIGARPAEIVFTSGATESNNLAILGYGQRRRNGGHIISVATEHKSVLDPLAKLERAGYEITRLPVQQYTSPDAGIIQLERLADAFRDDTFFVTVMLANNEIGVIQPLAEIAKICRENEVVLHTDATQAVGQFPVDVNQLNVDLMSFSAHKFYGPKGIGALYVRQTDRRIRLDSQIVGGGQQMGRRSGTLNVTGIVGMAAAIELACCEMNDGEIQRKFDLRNRLYQRLCEADGLREFSDIGDSSALSNLSKPFRGLPINGPQWRVNSQVESDPVGDISPIRRLAGNLNCQFPGIEGQSLMMSVPQLAVSSGSACTAADPAPSHVLAALGMSEDSIRSSIRFGIGRFNSAEEIDLTVEYLSAVAKKLKSLP